MKAFATSACIWGTVLTAIMYALMATHEPARNDPQIWTISRVLTIWVLVTILAAAYQLVRLARRFGANLGHALARPLVGAPSTTTATFDVALRCPQCGDTNFKAASPHVSATSVLTCAHCGTVVDLAAETRRLEQVVREKIGG